MGSNSVSWISEILRDRGARTNVSSATHPTARWRWSTTKMS